MVVHLALRWGLLCEVVELLLVDFDHNLLIIYSIDIHKSSAEVQIL